MEGVFVPVPNQPLYVWPIRASAIFSRGFVRGNRRLLSIGLHGHILLGGSQSIVAMYPSISSNIANKIFMYGYPLYTWFGRTPYGGTRYRILFIVWIWNYIVSNINVIARTGGVDQYVGICATSTIDTSSLNLTHFLVPHIDLDQVGYVAYTTDRLHRYRCVLATAVESSFSTKLSLITKLYNSNENTAKVLIDTHRGYIKKLAKLQVSSVFPELSRIYKVAISSRSIVDQVAKLRVAPYISEISRTLSLLVNPSRVQYNRHHKVQVHAYPIHTERSLKLHMAVPPVYLDQSVKIHANMLRPYQERTIKIIASTLKPYHERMAKVMVDTLPIHERVIKFIVHPVPNEIEKVMAFISTNLASHFHSDRMHIHSYLGVQPKTSVNVYSYLKKTEKAVDLLATLRELTNQYVDLDLLAERHLHERRKAMLSTVALHQTHKIIPAIAEHKDRVMVTGSMLEPKKERKEMVYHVHPYEERFNVHMNPIRLLDQWHRIEVDVLPLLAEYKVKFFPSLAPIVEQIGVMITVCHTHVLSYLNFVPDELQEAVDVLVSTCSYTTSSLLQWYLHGNRITNEGGNEIIFDLGEVDPIGPIPPVPSRQWEGGYVEDPFKGISYQPTADSTGFGSPSAEKWVSNTQMWWNSTANPWVDPEA